MKKKAFLFSLVFAVSMLIFGIPANAQTEHTLKPYTYTNPYYEKLEGVDTSNGIASYSLDEPQNVSYTDDLDQLIETFRKKMVSRENSIDLYYHYNGEITQEFFNQLCEKLFYGATEHTGFGKEGDYLFWHVQKLSVKAEIDSADDGGFDIHIIFTASYMSNASQEAEMDQAVSDLLQSLDLSGKTDVQKIKAIYDYICSNVTYDYDNLNNDSYTLKYTAYAALINKTAVCQGYASLFYRLSLEAGVDARFIAGTAKGPHAWNIVKIDGNYYNLDSTWDAGKAGYSYFLKGNKDFTNHERNEEYTTAEFTAAYPVPETSYQLYPSVKDYEYEVNAKNQVVITKYKGKDANVTTPATIADMPVIGIANRAFYDNKYIETLTISEGVQYVSSTLAGADPKLKQINLPSTLNFQKPDMLNLYTNPILGPCNALEKITVPESNPYICEENGILYNKDKTAVLCSVQNEDFGDLVLPDTVDTLNSNAFSYNKKLTSIQIPDKVTFIGYWAFEDCYNLVSVNIPRSLEFMGQYAFEDTSLQSLYIPKEIENYVIKGDTFYNWDLKKSLQKITVEDGNPSYKVVDGALIYNNTSLVLYAGGSTKTSYTVPDSITKLAWMAFNGAANLEKITLTGNITQISLKCFAGCTKLKTLTIPEGVTKIEDSAFGNCTNLQKLYLPKSLQKIESDIISNDKQLTDIYYAGTKQEWDKIEKEALGETTPVIHYSYNGREESSNKTGKWIKSGSKWWYRYSDGTYPANKLCKIGNTWYGFDAAGWMQTGWASHNNSWYYFNKSGVMQTGWQKIGGSWYYLASNGKMAAGWQKIGGSWYYLASSGKMVTGWQKIGGSWYYLASSGKMVTGWQKIGGSWYYFASSGKMAANTWVGNYYVNASGVWVRSR